MGQMTTHFTRFKLHLLPIINPEPLHVDPRCDPIINNARLLWWAITSLTFIIALQKTSKYKYPFTFSSDREGWVKDSVLKRDRLIHRIQLRNFSMAVEKVADAKKCHWIVLYWGIYQTWVTMPTTKPKLVAFLALNELLKIDF